MPLKICNKCHLHICCLYDSIFHMNFKELSSFYFSATNLTWNVISSADSLHEMSSFWFSATNLTWNDIFFCRQFTWNVQPLSATNLTWNVIYLFCRHFTWNVKPWSATNLNKMSFFCRQFTWNVKPLSTTSLNEMSSFSADSLHEMSNLYLPPI